MCRYESISWTLYIWYSCLIYSDSFYISDFYIMILYKHSLTIPAQQSNYTSKTEYPEIVKYGLCVTSTFQMVHIWDMFSLLVIQTVTWPIHCDSHISWEYIIVWPKYRLSKPKLADIRNQRICIPSIFSKINKLK